MARWGTVQMSMHIVRMSIPFSGIVCEIVGK